MALLISFTIRAWPLNQIVSGLKHDSANIYTYISRNIYIYI